MIRTIISVEGMKCPMCEKHVNEALIKAFDVHNVVSDHSINVTMMESQTKLDETEVTKVITDTGYQVTGFTYDEI